MEKQQTTLFRNFLWLAYAEGVSFIVLLAIAMPLKYIWDMPDAVRIIGMIHGVLFILYVMLAVYVSTTLCWGIKKLGWAIVASVLPFGPFFLHRLLQDK